MTRPPPPLLPPPALSNSMQLSVTTAPAHAPFLGPSTSSSSQSLPLLTPPPLLSQATSPQRQPPAELDIDVDVPSSGVDSDDGGFNALLEASDDVVHGDYVQDDQHEEQNDNRQTEQDALAALGDVSDQQRDEQDQQVGEHALAAHVVAAGGVEEQSEEDALAALRAIADDNDDEQSQADALAALRAIADDNDDEESSQADALAALRAVADDNDDEQSQADALAALQAATPQADDDEQSQADALAALQAATPQADDDDEQSEADALAALRALTDQHDDGDYQDEQAEADALAGLRAATIDDDDDQVKVCKHDGLLRPPAQRVYDPPKFTLESEFTLRGKALEVTEELGKGATATVWRGTIDDRAVALKQFVMTGTDPKDRRAMRKALKIEVDMMREHEHRNVLRYYGSFYSRKTQELNVVMELVLGGDLTARLKELGAFNEQLAAHVMFQTLEGLAFLHERDIIHRDLKV
jgi:Protein kinase domain